MSIQPFPLLMKQWKIFLTNHIVLSNLWSPMKGHFFRSFSNLTVPCEKAEALLPILAIACLGLNSSKCLINKQLLQTVFATALFFNRTTSGTEPFPDYAFYKTVVRISCATIPFFSMWHAAFFVIFSLKSVFPPFYICLLFTFLYIFLFPTFVMTCL